MDRIGTIRVTLLVVIFLVSQVEVLASELQPESLALTVEQCGLVQVNGVDNRLLQDASG